MLSCYFMICFLFALLQFLDLSPRLFAEATNSDSVFNDASIYFAGTLGLRLEEESDGSYHLLGEVQRASDGQKIRGFLSKHPEVENDTAYSENALKQMAKSAERILAEKGSRAQIIVDGQNLKVSKGISKVLENELKSEFPTLHFERESNSEAHKIVKAGVLLEISLIEIKSSALQQLGIRFKSPLAASSAVDFRFLDQPLKVAEVATQDPLKLFIDLALQKGEARIHSRQSLVTQNEGVGRFQAGGEFPIRISTLNRSEVLYKKFGLILQFHPKLLQNKQVHLDIQSEISAIDTSTLIDGLPVITKKELSTSVYASLDQMMAIGGMVRSEKSNQVEGIPGLVEIPIFGRLFRSEDFRHLKSEAFIFITAKKMDGPWLPQTGF